ncbi:mycofactocin biosynthesis peptidyl-dipeptidase MftE [Amycolatopsis sp. GM8]|uniref:mycofactocin biosynthesis peptidyl-dipeptidase MftE n=1 Tax=Amycolatopsis sp. GM8 TaxID=2896530 RepID=UPI001F01BAE3|nr:mycofactocin biosynthesis peptidyl-dipeptidase MftE [Amycolatopsis sp. GM8]
MKDHTWTELTPRLLAVPLGATEQHGPHLPFTVDTEIAVELCESLARQREDVTVAPPLPYGSSGEHAGFPGTLSIGQEATETVLVELVRSADVFAGVILVCAHGGNGEPLYRAVAKLRYEGRKVRAWMPSGPSDDSHAGRTETSVMLALRPESVRLDRLEAGNTRPLPELINPLRDGGVRAVSGNGVLGDPRGATADEGREILHGWGKSLLNAVAALATDVML